MTRLLLLLALAPPTFAQAPLPPGKDGYAYPPGGVAGTTVDVRLGGTDWTPDTRFFVHDSRVKLTVTSKPGPVLMPEPPFWFGIQSFANDPWLPREVTATLTIPKDMPPGPVRWSAANANGGGPGGVFVVGNGPEVTEVENRHGPRQLPALPVTVNGRLSRIEEVDRYRFTVAKTGPVTCELTARQIGSDFHGVLEIRDDTGKLLADVSDTEGREPVLTFAAENGRAYVLSVRDIEYRGYRNFGYRLALRSGPRVITAVPAAGKRGETRKVEFVGVGIATGQAKLETVTKDVTFPNDPARSSFAYTLESPFGTAQPFLFQLADAPVGEFAVPGAFTGRITKRGERETHTFTGKKGEAWEFAVQAKGIGSPLSVTLAVVGPDGKAVLAKDDPTGRADLRLPFTLPADGKYRVLIGDVSGRDPGLDSVYRLTASQPRPGFQLRTAGVTNLPVGGKAALTVTVVREGGFKEPITLAVAGLPAGVSVPKALVIPPTAATFAVPLECAKDAPASAALATLTGTAKVGDATVTQPILGEWKTDLAPRTPDANRSPRVLIATTLKVPFKVKAAEADGGRRIPRGSTHLTPILIERTDGFTGEIILDMAAAQQRHRQGIRGPALAVPPGTKSIDYPVFLPEWLETTRTSRIGLNAMAQVKDAKGTPRWVQAAMTGQVTMSIEGALMKVSHEVDELTLVPGATVELPLRLARSPKFAEPVRVELVVPDECEGVISAKPVRLAPAKSETVIAIETTADKRLVGTRSLTIRATGTRRGHPVVSETTVEVVFVPKGDR